MSKIIVPKEIFDLLMNRRKEYENEYFSGKVFVELDSSGHVSSHYLPRPEQYFVLGHKNRVKELVKIDSDHGCGGNNEITGQQLATICITADAKEMNILGFARVGMFNKENRVNVSWDYQRLMARNKWFEMIFGRDGYDIVRFKEPTGSWGVIEYKLELTVK